MEINSFIICTSPRSGSTLLCRLLSQTGVAGKPDSYFHDPSLPAWLDAFNLLADPSASEKDSLNAVFQAAIDEGTAGTGMFGLRLQRHSFDFFAEALAKLHPQLPGDRQRINAVFGRTAFVHLTRNDKLQQAVSFVKASQSGLWHMAPDGTELERLSAPKKPIYDGVQINRELERFTTYDAAWNSWFDREGIDPFRVSYETLAAAPQETLRHVLDYLGLDCRAGDGVSPDVGRLADETNRQWVERFKGEYGSR